MRSGICSELAEGSLDGYRKGEKKPYDREEDRHHAPSATFLQRLGQLLASER